MIQVADNIADIEGNLMILYKLEKSIRCKDTAKEILPCSFKIGRKQYILIRRMLQQKPCNLLEVFKEFVPYYQRNEVVIVIRHFFHAVEGRDANPVFLKTAITERRR